MDDLIIQLGLAIAFFGLGWAFGYDRTTNYYREILRFNELDINELCKKYSVYQERLKWLAKREKFRNNLESEEEENPPKKKVED